MSEKITEAYAKELAEFIVTGLCKKVLDRHSELENKLGESIGYYKEPVKICPQTDYITSDFIDENGGREGTAVYNEKLSEKEQIDFLARRIYEFLD